MANGRVTKASPSKKMAGVKKEKLASSDDGGDEEDIFHGMDFGADAGDLGDEF